MPRASRTSRPRFALPLLAAALAVCLAAPAAEAGPYRDGDPVVVTGLVTDRDGAPLADLRVVLEVSRTTFNLLELRRTQRETTRVAARTDANGEYTVRWPWDRFYNTFELLVGVPVRRADGDGLSVFERVDITRRVLQGSPAVVTVTVEDTERLARLREFLDTIRSADQRRTYQDMGQPDRVQTVAYPDRREVSWWYFGAGRVYRFRDGELERVDRFEPVPRFSDS